MKITVTLTGTTPLVMHNSQLADPDNEFTAQIAAITRKPKKTADDRAAIARLEWFGGLYVIDGAPVVLCSSVKRCFEEAAVITRNGKDIQRALMPTTMHSLIIHPGARDLETLSRDKAYIDRCIVGVKKARLVRVRPCFPKWAVECDFEAITSKLDLSAIKDIIDLAGSCVGLGDKRVKGYGRFTAKVVNA